MLQASFAQRIVHANPNPDPTGEGFVFAPAGIVDTITRFVFSNAFQFEFLVNLMEKRPSNWKSNFWVSSHKRRNELICRVFELVYFMEAKGTGLDKISEDYALADARHKPFVSCDDDSFTLTLPDLSYHDGVIGVENPYPSIHLLMPIASLNDERILSCCYAKERSLAEIASYLGVSPSTHLRKEVLEVLVSKGYLYQRQRGKAFVYWTNREKIRDSLVIKKF